MENATNCTFTNEAGQIEHTLDNTAYQTTVLLETEIGQLDEYALLEEKQYLFHEMLDKFQKGEQLEYVNAKGENFSALFLILILEQQKMSGYLEILTTIFF